MVKSNDKDIAYIDIRDYLKRKYYGPFHECELKATLGRERKIARENCYEVIKILLSLNLIKVSGKIGRRIAYVVC